MQQRKSQNAKDVLERLKIAYNIRNDTELAAFLGVARNTVSTWKTRNSIDYALVFAKCDNLNIDWLITGEGEIFKTKTPKNVIKENDNKNDNNFDNIPKLQKTLSKSPPVNEDNSPTETNSDSEVIREQQNVFTGMTDKEVLDIIEEGFEAHLMEMYEAGRAVPAVTVQQYKEDIKELTTQVARLEYENKELRLKLDAVTGRPRGKKATETGNMDTGKGTQKKSL